MCDWCDSRMSMECGSCGREFCSGCMRDHLGLAADGISVCARRELYEDPGRLWLICKRWVEG